MVVQSVVVYTDINHHLPNLKWKCEAIAMVAPGYVHIM